MQTGKPIGRIIGIVLIVILLFMMYTCKSKAESDGEHHYTSDFFTPDPSADIYDILETYEPDIGDFAPVTFPPAPESTEEPYIIMGTPFSVNLKYDPFLVYPAGSFLRWKRLNGSQATYQPPVPTSALHSASASTTTYSSGDSSVTMLDYTLSPNGVNETSTKFAGPNGAQLVYVLMQDFTTIQTAHQISVGDSIHIEFNPGITFHTEDVAYMFTPQMNYYIQLTFCSVDNNIVFQNVTDTEYLASMLNNGEDIISFDYSFDLNETMYLAGYEIFVTLNPNGTYLGLDGFRDATTNHYWFEQTVSPYFSISIIDGVTEVDKVGGFFSTLFNNISSIFVPNQTQIQNWINAHLDDELAPDNTLNVVKDLYVTIANILSGYTTGSRPVLDIPALSFNIAGYGKVTPFEGYQYEMTSNTPVDGEGRSLWYYVKLANSIALSSGLLTLLFRYFRKWYDAHYAG